MNFDSSGFLFELFHENSKLSVYDWEQFARIGYINQTAELATLAEAPTIDNTCLESIQLPRAVMPPRDITEVMRSRRSAMELGNGSLSLSALSALLHYSAGLNGSLSSAGIPNKALRFCPSPGGLYPITVLAEVRRVDGLTNGVYSYDSGRHTLGLLNADADGLSKATEQPGGYDDAACRLWLLCRFDRISFKYGERSYRFALLEAGHLAQNILLVGAASGLPVRPFGGFIDDLAISALKLQAFDLQPLYYVAVGGQ